MITVTDAQQVYEAVSQCPIGTSLDVELFGLAGGATGTLTLTRATELERWTYSGFLKISQETHARELSRLQSNARSGLSALNRSVRQALRGQVRTLTLRNPRTDGTEVVFEAQLVFETKFYILCRVRHSQHLQLHAGPYRLDIEQPQIAALTDSDRDVRREALLEILTCNSEPYFCMDEILRAGGSTETYNLDQLRLAIQALPAIFDEDTDRYLWECAPSALLDPGQQQRSRERWQ